MDQVRIDKWLWAARCFKTRSQATKACDGGLVKVEGTPVKASRAVKPGQTIDVRTPGGWRKLEVVGLGDRRVSASEAQKLYVDHTPEQPKGPTFEWRDPGAGRPTKRDRRRLARIKRGD